MQFGRRGGAHTNGAGCRIGRCARGRGGGPRRPGHRGGGSGGSDRRAGPSDPDRRGAHCHRSVVLVAPRGGRDRRRRRGI